MKKHTSLLRAVCSFLSLWMILCAFAGCGETAGPEITEGTVPASAPETEAATEPLTEPLTEPAPTEPTELVLVRNGVSEVGFVRPDKDGADDLSVTYMQTVRKELLKFATVTPPAITTDWEGGKDAAATEILFGCVDTEEGRAVTDAMGYGEYAVFLRGNKLVVNAFYDKAFSAAADRLCLLIEQHKTENADGTCSVIIPASELKIRGVLDTAINALPKYENRIFDYSITAGKLITTSYFYFNKPTNESLQNYLAEVEKSGFTPTLSDPSAAKPFYAFEKTGYSLQVALNRQAKRIEVTVRKLKNGAAAAYYGLCVKDSAVLLDAASSDGKETGKQLVKYDTAVIEETLPGGWYRITADGVSGYVRDTDVRAFPNLSELKGYAAVVWARDIAADNEFHYGYESWAHHHGCYFCGTNGMDNVKVRNGAAYEDQLKTYCCNPFVTAAYCHGAGCIHVGAEVTACVSCTGNKINLANDSNPALTQVKYFALIEKPESCKDLLPGDILLTPTHAMLVSENGMIVEASGSDDNVKNSDRWNTSIRERAIPASTWNGVTKVYRYVGD